MAITDEQAAQLLAEIHLKTQQEAQRIRQFIADASRLLATIRPEQSGEQDKGKQRAAMSDEQCPRSPEGLPLPDLGALLNKKPIIYTPQQQMLNNRLKDVEMDLYYQSGRKAQVQDWGRKY